MFVMHVQKLNIPWRHCNLEITACLLVLSDVVLGDDTHTEEEQLPWKEEGVFAPVSPPDRPPPCLAASSPVSYVHMPPLHPLVPVSYLYLGLD